MAVKMKKNGQEDGEGARDGVGDGARDGDGDGDNDEFGTGERYGKWR